MRGESRFARWLKVAAVLAVAECAGVPDVQAQSSGDVFRFDASYLRPGKYRENLFDPLRWEWRLSSDTDVNYMVVVEKF